LLAGFKRHLHHCVGHGKLTDFVHQVCGQLPGGFGAQIGKFCSKPLQHGQGFGTFLLQFIT